MVSPSTAATKARLLVAGNRTPADTLYANIYRSAVACGIHARWVPLVAGEPPRAPDRYEPTHLVVGGHTIRAGDETGGFVPDGELPVIAIWTDPNYDWAATRIAARDPAVSLHVGLDGPWIGEKPAKPAIGLWTPIDTATFRPDLSPRDWPMIYFSGKLTESRVAALRALRRAGIPMWPVDSETSRIRFPLPIYAAWIRSSVAVLGANDPKEAGAVMPQMKGRGFETLASRTVLLEHLPSPMAAYMSDGVEFAGWSTHDELIAAARAAIAGELDHVAATGHAMFWRRFAPWEWWDRVLAAA